MLNACMQILLPQTFSRGSDQKSLLSDSFTVSPIREDINNGSYKLSTNRCQVRELEAANVMFIPF